MLSGFDFWLTSYLVCPPDCCPFVPQSICSFARYSSSGTACFERRPLLSPTHASDPSTLSFFNGVPVTCGTGSTLILQSLGTIKKTGFADMVPGRVPSSPNRSSPIMTDTVHRLGHSRDHSEHTSPC